MLRHLCRILALSGTALSVLLPSAIAQHLATRALPGPATPVSLDPARNPAATLTDALRSLASRSGVVFLGRVDHIERQSGVVTVTLAVLDPMLGNPGPTYTLREWAGLWTLGRERYTVGQRALFFLHAPSASGLSSPVDGQFGVVPLLPTSADAAPLLDTRWLVTRLNRPVGAALTNTNSGTISVADAKPVVAHWNGPRPVAEPTRYPLPVALRPDPAVAR